MKKFLSSTLLLCFVGSYLSPVSAIDTTTSGRILDNFKEKQEEILFNSPLPEQDAQRVLEQEYAMNGLDALKSRLKTMEDAYTQKKSDLSEVRSSLENTLAALDASIQSNQHEIEETSAKITLKEQKIQQLEATGLRMRAEIRERRTTILSYLAHISSESTIISDTDGNVDIIKGMILSSGSTDTLLSDITYKTLVAEMGQKFVNEYRSLVRSYYLISVQTQEESKLLMNLKTGLENQKATLDAQKQEKERLLEITQGQEALYIQYIATQQQAQQQVESLWLQASEKYQQSFEDVLARYNCDQTKKTGTGMLECARIRQYFINEKELAKSNLPENTRNVFDWPIESRRITTFFHDAEYYQILHSQHEAIDIATPQGSDVRAPADGYVTFTLEPTPTGYSYMALRHREGLVTVYGHLSEILVSKYEFVKKGQVIAKSGGTPGTPGAGPMTSGAHLHFEVWKNRKSVDPLRYMSLSGLEYPTLPALYQDKFISDIIEKSGTGTDTSQYKKRFNIVGSSESDRQQYLLKTYATPDFQNWNMWADTALTGRIDPSFLMCVGLAETTLGNHLKTSYNIGNIGNTDDGGTYDFASPREGLEWMIQTLNNKYLGQYTKVSELSRWGNTDGPIYASSGGSWHGNVIRCLSALKGEVIDDDYEFRIK